MRCIGIPNYLSFFWGETHSFATMVKIDKELLHKLGARVELLRTERNMTQPQLAEAIGVKLIWIQRLEAGEIDARMYSLIKIADAFKMQVGEMFLPGF
jgi:DNA-binding XRE family transcriptional regulator